LNELEDMNKSIDLINPIIPKFVVHLPVVWFILGMIGFIGNTLTLLQYRLFSKTYLIYIFCNSIMDIIIVLFNLFLVYFVAIFDVDESWFPVSAIAISIPLLFLVLPHISINFLLMAYIDLFVYTSSRKKSCLRRINQVKMIPWMIIEDENGGIKLARIWSILYILTNGLIQPVLMLVLVVLTYQNRRKSHQRAVSVSFISKIESI
jgi:hypothetical protein